MSFYDFVVKNFSGEDTPLGDFAEDIQRDRDFPKDATTKEAILNYLSGCFAACYEAKQAFKELCELTTS